MHLTTVCRLLLLLTLFTFASWPVCAHLASPGEPAIFEAVAASPFTQGNIEQAITIVRALPDCLCHQIEGIAADRFGIAVSSIEPPSIKGRNPTREHIRAFFWPRPAFLC